MASYCWKCHYAWSVAAFAAHACVEGAAQFAQVLLEDDSDDEEAEELASARQRAADKQARAVQRGAERAAWLHAAVADELNEEKDEHEDEPPPPPAAAGVLPPEVIVIASSDEEEENAGAAAEEVILIVSSDAEGDDDEEEADENAGAAVAAEDLRVPAVPKITQRWPRIAPRFVKGYGIVVPAPFLVQPSTVENAGRGVFTTRQIPKDYVVGRYAGQIHDDLPAHWKMMQYLAKVTTIIDYPEATRTRYVDGAHGGDYTSLINTAGPKRFGYRNNCALTTHGNIVTTQMIRANKELFFGYGPGYKFVRGELKIKPKPSR